MGKSSIRPGFRFKPTDDELVMCYLKNKLLGIKLDPEFIAVVNINDFSPSDLPDKSILSGDQEWYFFWPILKKYNSGPRRNRTTKSGFWKRTGDGKKVIYKNRSVATRNTLIFHEGHRPKGERTDWVMHEFQMTDEDLANQGVSQVEHGLPLNLSSVQKTRTPLSPVSTNEAYVICRVFKKSGIGPKIGEHYGKPYEEKDWNDDDDDERSTVTSSMMIGVLVNTKNVSSSSMMNMTATEPGPSTITYGENEGLTNVTDVPVNDDVMLTHGDRASLLQNNNSQEVEDRKGKKVMIVPVNENDVTFEELVAMSNNDLGSDAFNMFSIDGSGDDSLDDDELQKLLDELED